MKYIYVVADRHNQNIKDINKIKIFNINTIR